MDSADAIYVYAPLSSFLLVPANVNIQRDSHTRVESRIQYLDQ